MEPGGDITSFEHALGLEHAVLQQTLEQGRPEQRVWAIWALALRAGEAAVGAATRVAREPDAGVRRTLAVMLAGRGNT
ncbi:MAG: hypothetical protein M3619_15235, partial [Myxococcota bacterium]|nr:hypothetical protein [Myxococcota bacterium]